MAAASEQLVHATAIAVGDDCVLICGPSGSGKSDLALRCLTLGPSPLLPGPVSLVADDQVHLRIEHQRLMASSPATIAGLIEIRGLGIARLPFRPQAHVRLVIELTDPQSVERLPAPSCLASLLGVSIPVVHLAPFEVSAAAKVLLALARTSGNLPFHA